MTVDKVCVVTRNKRLLPTIYSNLYKISQMAFRIKR